MGAINKYLPLGLKTQKLIPFFIAFKIIIFAGLLTYMISR